MKLLLTGLFISVFSFNALASGKSAKVICTSESIESLNTDIQKNLTSLKDKDTNVEIKNISAPSFGELEDKKGNDKKMVCVTVLFEEE